MGNGDADVLKQRHRTSVNADNLIFIQRMTEHRDLVLELCRSEPEPRKHLPGNSEGILRAWPWPSRAIWPVRQPSSPDGRNSARCISSSSRAEIIARASHPQQHFRALCSTGTDLHGDPAPARPIPYGTPPRLSRFTSSGQSSSGRSATQAQVKAVYAICDSQGLTRDMLACILNGRYRWAMAKRLVCLLKPGQIPFIKPTDNEKAVSELHGQPDVG